MWLLYLDESGTVGQHSNFVLGGVAVFEGQVYNTTRALNDVAEVAFPDAHQSVELHVRELRNLAYGKTKQFSKEQFFSTMDNLAQVIRNSAPYGLALLGTVVHIPSLYPGNEPYPAVFEDVCSRFNAFLVNKHKRGDTQKGMVILDFSSQQDKIRQVAAVSRVRGDRWGHQWVNLPEAPLFVESSASRLVQLADYVAHALFRRYEFGQARDLDKILRRFDSEEGVIHGIGHIIFKKERCMCSACVSRMGRETQSPVARNPRLFCEDT